MRKQIIFILAAALLFAAVPLTETKAQTATSAASGDYVPSESNIKARKEFSSKRLGIFLHWGIYAMYGQGEWYLNNGRLLETEYRKAAKGFYPIEFNADEWIKAFKDAGAGYITFTSRHHDGFSMFKTSTSDYNVVDGTPFGRDVVGELAKACAEEGRLMELNECRVERGGIACERYKKILGSCVRYGTHIIVSSDAHFYTHIGQFEPALTLLREIGFPEELIVNADEERFLQYIKSRNERINKNV